jgi:two-component system chemotaxis sensor kinase CheA
MVDLNPAVDAYVQESRDILEGLESALLDLEQDPDPEKVDAVFRGLHTLKGGGAMFGFRLMSGFIHHFEDAFDRVREGRLGITSALINLALKARDQMTAMLDCGGDGSEAETLINSAAATGLLADLARTVQGGPAVAPVKTDKTWRIHFRPARNALHNGMRPERLIDELGQMGQAEVVIDGSEVPPLAEYDPAISYLAWDVRLTTTQPRSAIEAVFIFADDAELEIAEDSAETPDTLIETAPTAQAAQMDKKPAPQPQKAEAAGDSVRVSSNKLDEILDQLGELVIAQARLSQISAEINQPTLEGLVEEVERLVTGLRDATLSVRMLPIEMVFGKFRRVVRDLSNELGKDVVLETEGGDTEIDKNVLDRLSEPLVHMIRNSIDHGIENASIRSATGKPARGRLLLSARQEAGEILICIEDDGKGLDAEAIRKKAIERGLISTEDDLTTSELHKLIFAPGFSTAATVSSVSGRGVGMDAVLTTVSALRGVVDVQSRPGQGTRVTLRLPLTLAIIDGLLVRLGSSTYVIPLASVEECVEFDAVERRRDSGRTMLQIREQLVPFIDLIDAFNDPPSEEPRRRVVIVKADGQRVGLVVDDILGQNQTVIKSLGPYHAEVSGFAGATILGDGSVALICDVNLLARSATASHGLTRNAA